MALALDIWCKKHREYTGSRKPRAACDACVQIYRLRLMIKSLPQQSLQEMEYESIHDSQRWDSSQLKVGLVEVKLGKR